MPPKKISIKVFFQKLFGKYKSVEEDTMVKDMQDPLNLDGALYDDDPFLNVYKEGNYPMAIDEETIGEKEKWRQNLEMTGEQYQKVKQEQEADQLKYNSSYKKQIIEARKALYEKNLKMGLNLGGLTQDLAKQYNEPGYYLRNLQKEFFGEGRDMPAWRNNIIYYYLVELGWEYDKDPADWITYKYIIDEATNSEQLVLFTPIPGLIGREAAFGFVRHDLTINETYFLYQQDRTAYDKATTVADLKQDNQMKLNQKILPQTVEEAYFDETYTPLDSKTAILIAYDLVHNFETKEFVIDISSKDKGKFIHHQNYITLSDILDQGQENGKGYHFSLLKDIRDKKRSRRDYLVTWQGQRQPQRVGSDYKGKSVSLESGTTLTAAKKIFIEGNNYSQQALIEEGLGANMLIRYFPRFQEGIAKAIFFIHAFGKKSTTGDQKARKAIDSYKEAIENAYLFPKEQVDFSKGDRFLNEAFLELHQNLYGESGVLNKRIDLANETLKQMQITHYLYPNTIQYLQALIDSGKQGLESAPLKDATDLTKLDYAPFQKVEKAISILDIASQVGLIRYLNSKDVETGNTAKYFHILEATLGEINRLLVHQEKGYEKALDVQIEKGLNVLRNPAYFKALEIDQFIAETTHNLDKSQAQLAMIGAVVVSFYVGGIAGEFVAGIVGGTMSEAFAASALGLLITDLAEVTTAALVSTLLQQSFETLIEGKEFGKDFGKELLINLVLIGAAKVFEVVLIGRAAPSGATQLGKGVWRSFSAEGRPVYYIERALLPESEAAMFKIAGPKPNHLIEYGNIRAELRQVQNVLKSQGADPYLVENALRRLDVETLEYFEKNTGKLLEASERLPGAIKNFDKLAPGPKLAETQKYLFRSTFEEVVAGEEKTIVKINKENADKYSNGKKIWQEVQTIKNKHPEDPFPTDGVLYGTAEIENGLIKNVGDKGNQFKEVDFVVTKSGELKLGKKHVFLANGEDVEAAGTLKIVNGKVKSITNHSGHYFPEIHEAENFPKIFRQLGIDTKNTYLEIMFEDKSRISGVNKIVKQLKE